MRFIRKSFSTIIAIALIVALLLIPVPFIRIAPGPVFNTVGIERDQKVIQISGIKTYESKGELNFTTVSESGGPFGRLVLIDAIAAWLNPTQAVLPAADLYPVQNDPEVIKMQNARAFSGSQTDAISAALGYLKIDAKSNVVVESVVLKSPSDGKIDPGDIVNSVNSNEVLTPGDVVKFVQQNKPGEIINLMLSRKGQDIEVNIKSVSNTSDKDKASIGIAIVSEIDPPFNIKFGIADVGGPSAGLMMALGIIDELTEKDLTAGQIIAGTGTINSLGQVGPIGGIRQKLAGAKDNGVQLFLAPIDNCDSVKTAKYKNMPVVAVATLAEAVKAIETFTNQGNAKGLKTCE